MTRVIAVLLLLALGASSALAVEICPGCMGGGRVGCPGCANAFGVLFVGQCGNCRGFWAWRSDGAACRRCYGTGVCSQCQGKGQACWGCKGTGRVPDGTTAAFKGEQSKKQRGAVAGGMAAIKRLAGSWRAKGTDDGKPFESDFAWRPCLDGTFLRLTEKTRYADGRTTASAAMLTYDAAASAYVLHIFLDRARIAILRGAASGDRAFDFTMTLENGRQLKLGWRFDEDGSVRSDTSISTDDGWSTTALSRAVRGGEAPAEEDVPLAADLAKLGLTGAWSGTFEESGKRTASELLYRGAVDGTWLTCAERATRPGGAVEEYLSWLAYDAGASQYVTIVYADTGRVIPFKGTAPDERTIALEPADGQKMRWTWRFADDAKSWDGTVELPEGDGWRVVSSGRCVRK